MAAVAVLAPSLPARETRIALTVVLWAWFVPRLAWIVLKFLLSPLRPDLRLVVTDGQFAAELREINAWNREHGYGPARIDPGYDPALKAAFEGLGLSDMLH